MVSARGHLSLEELRQRVESGEIDTVQVAATDCYGRLVGKRYDAEFFLEAAVRHGSHFCDYLFTVDMEMNPVPGYAFSNWERGYGDVHMEPDFSTLRIISWLDRTALVLCDTYTAHGHQSVEIAPRSILRRQVAAAAEHDWQVMGASELEYYLLQDSYRSAHAKGYDGLDPAGHYIEDYHLFQGTREEPFTAAARRHLRDSGIPVENSKGEWGLGQHELNVRYTELLEMADRHTIFKQCLREIAELQGLSLTFMAKYRDDQAGSSCHIHLSLWKDGENAFVGDLQEGPARCSETFRHFLGGWMAHAPEVMVFYAPTINSYKRYQSESWAPTGLAWSHDNRTAGFRVVGEGSSLRIECRIPGADCNPYLAFAASLASGLDGIAQRIEPPPMFEGDVYQASHVPQVPTSLRDAIDRFSSSEFARAAFGPEVVDHYTHFYRSEQAAYDRAVTDWERKRYFERI